MKSNVGAYKSTIVKHGQKLSIEVEAQPVPQKTTISHKNHAKREKGETSAARRDGAQQGNCHRTKKGESSRLPKNELLTGTLGHRHQPQYQPYRISAETREGRYWERSIRGRQTSKGARNKGRVAGSQAVRQPPRCSKREGKRKLDNREQ